jgi:predicted RNA methylase
MALARQVETEWLDHLPAQNPRAIRSRRDLKLINVMMLQAGIMARALRSNSAEKPRTILDLGAGDGTFMLGVARRLSSYWRDVDVILVDRQNIISDATCREFRTLYFRVEPVVADVFDWSGCKASSTSR